MLTIPEPASIAIWNKNKLVVAIAIAVWLTCASFLIHGKSISFSLSKRISSISDKHVMTTGTTQVSDGLNHLGSSGLIHPQIRAEWVPHYLTCGPPNTHSNILAITAMLVSDIALLIMLIGLLRLRHRGGGIFDLGRLLWKQVRWLWVQ